MKTNESCHGRTGAIHPSGGLANTGSALNNHDYLRSSAADCFFQDYTRHPRNGPSVGTGKFDMPFVGLTKPAIVTTPKRRDLLCYDFPRKNTSAPRTYPREWLRYCLETHREPFVEHLPEALPKLRRQRGDQRYALWLRTPLSI